MAGLTHGRFQGVLLLVFCIAVSAVAILWFLMLALRSFYPVQGGDPRPPVDAGFFTQAALALVCAGVVVVFLVAARRSWSDGTRSSRWLAGALVLGAVLVVLALTAERFIHAGPAYSETPPVYDGEAALWATYFWVTAAGVLAIAVLSLLRRPSRR